MRIALPSVLGVLLVAIVVACSTPVADPEVEDEGGFAAATPRGGLETLPAGDALPEAELPYLDRDGALEMGELRGTPALVNFWATWCTFCVDEMPDFEEVHSELDGQVRFIGVNVEDRHDKALVLAEETGVTYELVIDDDRSYYFAVLARGMPTTLFVDDEGRITYRHAGPLDADGLRELIEEHLDVDTGHVGTG